MVVMEHRVEQILWIPTSAGARPQNQTNEKGLLQRETSNVMMYGPTNQEGKSNSVLFPRQGTVNNFFVEHRKSSTRRVRLKRFSRIRF